MTWTISQWKHARSALVRMIASMVYRRHKRSGKQG
jgi:hypothetical protein